MVKTKMYKILQNKNKQNKRKIKNKGKNIKKYN